MFILAPAFGYWSTTVNVKSLSDSQRAIKAGYSEITLLGQNVNSWGLEKESIVKRKATLPQNHEQYRPYKGLPPFVKLLRALSALKEIKKIRFLTANPWDFYPELIKEIGENKKIDRYLDRKTHV